jgi:hypothetical protein
VRLDLAPVVAARKAQDEELVVFEVYLGGLVEESAVDVSRFRVQAPAGPGPGSIEPVKELAEVVGAGSSAVLDEAVDDARVERSLELAKVFGEQAPHRLQKEVAPDLWVSRVAIAELVVEAGHEADSVACHGLLGADERWLAIGEDKKRFHAVG